MIDLAWEMGQWGGATTGYGTVIRGLQRGFEDIGLEYRRHELPDLWTRLKYDPKPCTHGHFRTPQGWVDAEGLLALPDPQVLEVRKLSGHPLDGVQSCRRGHRYAQFVHDHEPHPLSPPWEPRRTGDPRLCLAIPDAWRWDNASRRVGLTMWESSRLPHGQYGWGEWLDTADRIVVPCPHNAGLIREALGREADVIPMGLHSELWPYHERSGRTGPFTFLMVGDLSWRKGFDLAYGAFWEAFRGDPNVRMVFKVRGSAFLSEISKSGTFRYTNTVEDHNVKVLRGDWRQIGIRRLYQMADCFVWPTRGEGWGLPPREAAATGLPVITCQHTGQFDADEWAYVIGHHTGRSAYVGRWGECGTWYEPDKTELIETMRYVYENREEAYAFGREAADVVRRRTWRDVATDLAAILQPQEVYA